MIEEDRTMNKRVDARRIEKNGLSGLHLDEYSQCESRNEDSIDDGCGVTDGCPTKRDGIFLSPLLAWVLCGRKSTFLSAFGLCDYALIADT